MLSQTLELCLRSLSTPSCTYLFRVHPHCPNTGPNRLCGQSFFVGRYCTHFHMAGTESQSYVRFNSIHHSFQRAVTTHATESANIIGNFAYHVYGHTIFVEDGV